MKILGFPVLKTISGRIAFSFFLISFIVIGAFLLVAYNFFSLNLNNYLNQNPLTIAEAVASDLSQEITSGKSIIELRPLIDEYARKYGAVIIIFDRAGVEILSSGEKGTEVISNWCVGPMTVRGARMIAAPIGNEFNPSGFVGVILTRESSIEAASESFRTSMVRAFSISAVLSLVFALIIGFVLTKGISEPIRNAITGAEKLAAGEFDVRLSVTDRSEIGDLSQSVNLLATRLKELEKRRLETAADIAHEFKTPLTIVKANLEAMADGILPVNRKSLEKISSEIDRLTKLVDGLKEIRLLEESKLIFPLEKVDLVELVRDKTASYRVLTEEKKIKLDADFSEKPQLVHANREKLMQVIDNIFSNALRFTGEGGEITIRVKGYRDEGRIYISDTGIGIPPEKIPLVFERFYTAEESRSREKSGSGLGLSIAKSLVELMNGTIKIDSRLGKGTTIIIGFKKIKEAKLRSRSSS